MLRHAHGRALAGHGHEKYAGTTRKSGKRHVWTGRVNVDKTALTAPLSVEKAAAHLRQFHVRLFQDKADEVFIRQVWRVMEQRIGIRSRF